MRWAGAIAFPNTTNYQMAMLGSILLMAKIFTGHGHPLLVLAWLQAQKLSKLGIFVPFNAQQANFNFKRYNEINQYDYSNPGFSSATGHFTQVVWKSTTKIGCARCSGPYNNGCETYIVCNYQTPGNLNTAQAFRDNVLPQTRAPDQSAIDFFWKPNIKVFLFWIKN